MPAEMTGDEGPRQWRDEEPEADNLLDTEVSRIWALLCEFKDEMVLDAANSLSMAFCEEIKEELNRRISITKEG